MESTLNIIIELIMCHLIGDYVLQSEFLATTKGENWYHMFIHCALYTLPFIVCFGIDLRALAIFVIHFIVDTAKARYHKIGYLADQYFHYWLLTIYLI